MDIPAMGSDPKHKDIFVEIDYMVDQGHNHQPKPTAIDRIVNSFANAPVPNPDGKTGINLHIDSGPDSVMNPVTGEQWKNFSQANSLPHDNELGSKNTNYDWTEFDAIKNSNFAEFRASVFHYVIFAHNLGGYGGTSGISRGIGGSDFIVSLGSWTGGVGTVNEQAGTFMHELGHNLGLKHGGDDHTNYEPNFLSVMNYSFQTRGLIINGQEGSFDYSRFALPDLNENNLDEAAGLNGGAAVDNYGTRYYCAGSERVLNNANGQIDWNCNNNNTNTNVQTDINKDGNRSTLGSYNDWANLVFTGGAIGQPGAIVDLPTETEVEEITELEDANITSLHKVAVTGTGDVAVVAGSTITYTFTISNMGTNNDSYTITVRSDLGWVDLIDVPASLTLASGANTKISIPINTPSTAAPGIMDRLSLSAISQANPLVEDGAIVSTTVTRYQIFLPLVIKK